MSGLYGPPAARTSSYVVAPPGWDNGWKLAKAASATTPANALILGDSYTWGAVSTDIPNKSWPMLLRSALQTAYGRAGDFYHSAWSSDYNTYAATSTPFTGTSPWTTILTTNRGYANRGFGKALYWSSGFSAGGSNFCVFTTPDACTAIDIITQDNTAGTFGYKVDGGAVQTVTATSGGWLRRTAITGLANTTHTITFDNQSVGVACAIVGIACYTANGGVNFANVSITGGSMLDVLGIGQATIRPDAFLQGKGAAQSITAATNATPIVLTTTAAHQLKAGANVAVASVGGNTAANGTYYVSAPSATTLGLYTDRALTTPVAGNGNYTSGGTVTPSTGFGFPAQPHLAIVSYGINDCQNFYGVEGFRQSYRRTIQGLRRGNPECSIIVMANCLPDMSNSETTSGLNQPQNWQFFMDSLYSLAGDYNCAFVNIHAKWGELSVTYGFQAATQPHPTDAGHADINAVLQTIL